MRCGVHRRFSRPVMCCQYVTARTIRGGTRFDEIENSPAHPAGRSGADNHGCPEPSRCACRSDATIRLPRGPILCGWPPGRRCLVQRWFRLRTRGDLVPIPARRKRVVLHRSLGRSRSDLHGLLPRSMARFGRLLGNSWRRLALIAVGQRPLVAARVGGGLSLRRPWSARSSGRWVKADGSSRVRGSAVVPHPAERGGDLRGQDQVAGYVAGGVGRGPRGRRCVGRLDLGGWPDGMRVIVRRDRPHSGADLT